MCNNMASRLKKFLMKNFCIIKGNHCQEFGKRTTVTQKALAQSYSTAFLNESAREVVGNDLSNLVQLVKSELGGRGENLFNVASYYFDGQGKAIRPVITVLMSRAVNAHFHPKQDGFLLHSQKQLALITEMIHTATLVHDDVIDMSDKRRGKPSVNERFGQQTAVIGGDYIIAKAGAMVARLKNDEVTMIIAQVLEDLVHGEFMQLGEGTDRNAEAYDQFSQYMQKTFNKTASLMAYSCKGVALLGKADKSLSEAAFEYGKNAGIAFQLVDDMLDYVSSVQTLGKPVAADLRLGLATAPVLYAAEEYPQLHLLIQRKFSDPTDIEEALLLVRKSEGLEKTRQLAKEYCLEAKKYAKMLNESIFRNELISLTDQILNRNK